MREVLHVDDGLAAIGGRLTEVGHFEGFVVGWLFLVGGLVDADGLFDLERIGRGDGDDAGWSILGIGLAAIDRSHDLHPRVDARGGTFDEDFGGAAIDLHDIDQAEIGRELDVGDIIDGIDDGAGPGESFDRFFQLDGTDVMEFVGFLMGDIAAGAVVGSNLLLEFPDAVGDILLQAGWGVDD